ncbi:MAG TPA: hypothetical protein VNL16_09765 [Chloroflexota bacterium]|nr:hypothetical protein [Chloroflexota bacterium]
MTSLHFDTLEIDDHVLDKIEVRHGVAFAEVLEACSAEERHVRRSREGLYKVFSQSAAGCYLLVVLANHEGGIWKVATAREMTREECRLYQRSRGE